MFGNPSDSSLIYSQYLSKGRLVHTKASRFEYEEAPKQRYNPIQFDEDLFIIRLRWLHKIVGKPCDVILEYVSACRSHDLFRNLRILSWGTSASPS